MGYHLKEHSVQRQNLTPPFQPVAPKTHTPFSPVQERGLRFYNPELGRWINRDPIEEKGHRTRISHRKRQVSLGDLYVFAANSPLIRIDPLGLEDEDLCAAAQKGLKIPINEAGALVCHKGKLLGCVWNKGKEIYTKYPGLRKCVQLHEDEHVKQNPNVTCEACTTYFVKADPDKKPQDECAAYTVEIDCLTTEHKTACGSDYDPNKNIEDMSECEIAFWAAIISAKSHQDVYCKQSMKRK